MKIDELRKILDQHRLWLKTPNEGKIAHLREADLREADLREADIFGTGIFTFQIVFFAFYHESSKYKNGYLLKIGCKDYFDLDERIAKNEQIGKKHEYTKRQIKQHLKMLEFIKDNILSEDLCGKG